MRVGIFTFLSLILSACAPPPVATTDDVPRVKVYVVGEQASGQTRRFSGRVVAADVSPLSFGIGGTIDKVLVKQGDRVRTGQILAMLDGEELRLIVEQARAQLTITRAKLTETQHVYDRTRGLFNKGAASQAEVEAATVKYQTARGNVRAALSDLKRRERDLNRIELIAPFDGTVAKRAAEPFQEVPASQEIVVIQSNDAFEVQVNVPETLIRLVDYAQPVSATFPSALGASVPGVVSEIGSQAQSGNSFQVSVQLADSDVDLRAGMTAAVIFNFDQRADADQAVYLLPLSSLAIDAALIRAETGPAEDRRHVPVYIVDDDGRLALVLVSIGDVRGNDLEVYAGLQAGDKVVNAGVPFLSEGMKVQVWDGDLSDG